MFFLNKNCIEKAIRKIEKGKPFEQVMDCLPEKPLSSSEIEKLIQYITQEKYSDNSLYLITALYQKNKTPGLKYYLSDLLIGNPKELFLDREAVAKQLIGDIQGQAINCICAFSKKPYWSYKTSALFFLGKLKFSNCLFEEALEYFNQACEFAGKSPNPRKKMVIQNRISATKEKISNQQFTIDRLTDKICELDKQISEKKRLIAGINSTEEIDLCLNKKRQEIAAYEENIVILHNTENNLSEKNKALGQRCQYLSAQVETNEANLVEVQGEIKSLTNSQNDLLSQVKHGEEELGLLKIELEKAQSTLNEKMQLINQSKKQLTEIKESISIGEQKYLTIQSDIKKITDRFERLRNDAEFLQLQEKEKQIEQYKQEIAQYLEQLQNQKSMFNERKKQIEDLEKQISIRKKQLSAPILVEETSAPKITGMQGTLPDFLGGM